LGASRLPCLPSSQVAARPVTKDWLSLRSVYISPAQSAQIYAALVKARVISKQGDVLYDVRVVSGGTRPWRVQRPGSGCSLW
jgi:hypothetical protein